MSDSPLEFDLKILPDWLKEPAGKNPYADFEGESERRGPRRDFDRGPGRPGGGRPGGGRPGGPGRPGGQARPGGGGPRDSRDFRGSGGGHGPRPAQAHQGKPPEEIKIPQRPHGAPPRPPLSGQSGSQGQRDQQRPDGRNRDNRDPRGQRPGGPPQRRDGAGDPQNRDSRPRQPEDRRPFQDRPQAPQARPERVEIPLQVEILPETDSISAVTKQIKTSHRAYPLYGMGRMFLVKPERHRVRVTSNAPAHPLFQVGEEGPVTLHRGAAERDAFRQLKGKYYTEETVSVDAPKGNYTNVARCRLSGVLLGPTNHHGYQPALRKLFDARFSRRMDFQEFLRQIEVVNDPAVVEEWKKQVSATTVFRTLEETEPKEFKSIQEVEAHFRATYLPGLIRSGRTLEMSGVASREVADREIRDAIRTAWEKERGFPVQIVNHVRPRFMEAGLYIWRHRKRILYVSPSRPVRFGTEAKNVSEHIADILNIIETSPKCTRADIATRLLKPHEAEPEFPKLKAAIVSDLHWLIQSGHVIEFHDGTLDLPLLPKELAKEAQGAEAAMEEEPAAPSHAPTASEPLAETETTEEVSADVPLAVGQDPRELPVGEEAALVPPAEEAAPEAILELVTVLVAEEAGVIPPAEEAAPETTVGVPAPTERSFVGEPVGDLQPDVVA